MSRPPVRDEEALLRAHERRIKLLERRLAASGGVPFALPDRLGPQARPITDWNDATETGWWMGNNAANAPFPGTWFIGTVEAHTPMWVTQTVHAFTADAAIDTIMFRRSSSDSGSGAVWGGWYRVRIAEAELDARYARTEIANTKYCAGQVTVNVPVPNGGGVNVSVTFPVGFFSSPPKVWGIFWNGRPVVSIQGATPPTTTGATLRLDNWSPIAAAAGSNLDWFAMGVGP